MLWLQFRLLKNLRATPNDVLRISSVTLIITFSLALAAFLDDLKEAAPVFGLFSTIAGYLLGSAHNAQTTKKESTETTRPFDGKEGAEGA